MADIRITVFDAEAIREAVELSTEDRAQIAGEIADESRAAAHVDTGEYRAGIGVEVDGTRVAVVNNDETAGFKEYGTSDTAPQATMTNAARRHGKYSGIQPGRR
jgi:hypothetical protein